MLGCSPLVSGFVDQQTFDRVVDLTKMVKPYVAGVTG